MPPSTTIRTKRPCQQIDYPREPPEIVYSGGDRPSTWSTPAQTTPKDTFLVNSFQNNKFAVSCKLVSDKKLTFYTPPKIGGVQISNQL